MKIDVWSDYQCPFCYIGKRRLEEALLSFSHRDEVETVFRSFELSPDAERDIEGDMHSVLAAKYGMSRDEAKAASAQVAAQAKQIGLTYHFDTLIPTNSLDAHRLTHFAAKHGKMEAMSERLFKAYFTDSLHLGDRETLAVLAAEIGLDSQEVKEMLAGGEFTKEVRADEQEASRLGVRGVPFFVINRKYAISGAQPLEVFQEALQKAWDEEEKPLIFQGSSNPAADASGGVCEDGSCQIPGSNKSKE